MERDELEARLIKRAWEDQDFKHQLLIDPKGVVEREIGQSLPDDVEIYVVEESAKEFYFRLPVNPDNLPDAIMDLVAGGESTCGQHCWNVSDEKR